MAQAYLGTPPMNRAELHTPPGTGLIGMALFLASLTMLFISGLLGYALIRLNGDFSPPIGAIHIPHLLWLSTIIVLVSSVTMQHALGSLRRERQQAFRNAMMATLALAVLFIVVQAPALHNLLQTHFEVREQRLHLYGLVFVLILLHALHVVGGLIPMIVACIQAYRGRYDHEHYRPIQYLTLYWHFLDIVWVVMFATLLVLS